VSTTVKPWASLNWPNRISIIRLLLILPFVVLMLNHDEWGDWARLAALGIFVVMGLSDFVDGQLARRLHERTRLGAILDPLADKALIITSVILLAHPATAVAGAKLSNWIVVAVIGKDLWVILGFLVVYLATDQFMVRPSIAGKASTFAQLMMVCLVLFCPEINRVRSPMGTYLAVGASYLVVGACVAAVIGYTRMGLSFLIEKGRPLDEGRKELPGGPGDKSKSD
jgi:cardiolipin synthase